MMKHLVKRFGSFEAEWKKAPEGWVAFSQNGPSRPTSASTADRFAPLVRDS